VEGAAVWAASESITITSSSLNNNESGAAGGAVYAASGTITINKSIMGMNNTHAAGGSAVSGVSITVSGSMFIHNTYNDGANLGLSLAYINAALTNVTYQGVLH
jgi:hypothetical protein